MSTLTLGLQLGGLGPALTVSSKLCSDQSFGSCEFQGKVFIPKILVALAFYQQCNILPHVHQCTVMFSCCF